MKSFIDFLTVRESASPELGDGVLRAFSAVCRHFPEKCAEFLNSYAHKAEPSSFSPGQFSERDFGGSASSSSSEKVVSKGFGDMSGNDGEHVVSPNHADSGANPLG